MCIFGRILSYSQVDYLRNHRTCNKKENKIYIYIYNKTSNKA